MTRIILQLFLALLFLLLLGGCDSVGYYWQCLRGQVDLLDRARPVEAVINDPETDEAVREKLELASSMRDFATASLSLPDNQSYRSFADLKRDYALWNVVATDEFSLRPQQWCFPVAGCVSYRGFFDSGAARDFAAELEGEGKDVFRYGVTAYSTLNWFDDPLLNTFWRRSETGLAGLLFHELAHQVVYLKGDSEFNESFASAVEIAGTLQWLKDRHQPDLLERYRRQLEIEARFHRIALETRQSLEQLYVRPLAVAEKRQRKQVLIKEFQERLTDLAVELGNERLFASWSSDDLNNARFALLGTYRDLVPAFLNLLALKNYRYPAFYAEVKRLSGLPMAERAGALRHLQTLPHYAGLFDRFSG